MEIRNRATRVCIIRHGETDWNVEKRIQGNIDVPLNATGIGQAFAAAEGLASQTFDAIYSSDLDRAWQTALRVAGALGLPVTAAHGLRERNYGVLQGLTAADIAARYPTAYGHYLARDPHHGFRTGECLADFAARIAAAVEELAGRHPGGRLLLVSHGGVLDICYRRATGRPLSAARDFKIPNAALNWFEVGPDGWQLLEWADRRHLERTLEESPE